MQIKEFEAYTLKECLQQVRDALGSEAVILETRKCRKGGLLGLGARDAVRIVAAIGVTVKSDLAPGQKAAVKSAAQGAKSAGNGRTATLERDAEPVRRKEETVSLPVRAAEKATAGLGAAVNAAAARSAYARQATAAPTRPAASTNLREERLEDEDETTPHRARHTAAEEPFRSEPRPSEARSAVSAPSKPTERETRGETETTQRFTMLEGAMREIRDCLTRLHRDQQASHERTVSAVVSAVAPAVSAVNNVVNLAGMTGETRAVRFPELFDRLIAADVNEALARDLMDELPDFGAWSEEAQEPLARAALKDLIGRRVCSYGPIALTPGTLKAVALIGPTGVGKTTTIAKLAAHFALKENKRVALLTVDTYRIAAVEQLKIYSQILDCPVGVAYNLAEVPPAVAQFADYDLLLIDTAGRSQKNIMQVGELKSLLEMVGCETHLALSASTKEQDMIEAAQRFSAARVDRILFTKLDETDTYGTLLNVADKTGLPLSYLTTGQKVPEDIELADGGRLATLLLD